MRFLSDADREGLLPAEETDPRTPLPVRMMASEEYIPVPQTARQRRPKRGSTRSQTA